MSHNIQYYSFPADTDKVKIQAEMDNYVRHEDWQEGAVGLPRAIRWLDQKYASYSEAEKAIEHQDRGDYDQLAVQYYALPKGKSKHIEEKQEAYAKLQAKYQATSQKIHYEDVKAEFISCKNCGSKLATAYVKHYKNRCPICGSDLRPKTIVETLAKQKERIRQLADEIAALQKKAAPKPDKSTPLYWLVKIEYHT